MPERPIPTFVWFDRPDRIFSFWPRTLEFSLNGVFELKCALRDWKINICKRTGTSASNTHKLISKIIEGAADIVDSVSGDDGDTQRDILANTQIANALSGLRVVLDSTCIWFGCEKATDLTLKIGDVFAGSFNF